MAHNHNMPDELDFAKLSVLQKVGRMSFTVIAKKLHVFIGTICTRFNKLIEEDTINIIGRVNPDKAGFRSYALIAVFLRTAPLKEAVAKQIVQYSKVSLLAMTSGDYDLKVDFMCRENDYLVNFF